MIQKILLMLKYHGIVKLKLRTMLLRRIRTKNPTEIILAIN